MELEICVDSVESAVASAQGGADRIELCCALSEGGITPSGGLISAVRDAVDIQLFVIIRPRGGDFVYSGHELDVMRRDIEDARQRGVDGVVLGVLTPEDTVDMARTREMIELARPLPVTFHRAFDVCKDMDRALEDVIACGAERLLTSGGKSDAVQGMSAIAALREQAGNRIRIMAGGGIRTANVRKLALRTGIHEIHTSLCTRVRGKASDGSLAVDAMHGGFTPFLVRENEVREFKSALQPISLGTELPIQ